MIILIVSSSLGFGQDEANQKPQAIMPAVHAKVFETYCYDCHDSGSQEGSIDLESISFDLGKDIPTAERWQKILNVVNSGEMPPKDETQISAEEKTAFLDSLSNQIVVARKILSDNGGVITLRRLNRREYQNTLEALLGVRPNVSDLPDDQGSSDFDTAGASLFFSSDQLEQYLAVAAQTLEIAFFHKPVSSELVRIEAETENTPLFQKRVDMYQDIVDRSDAFHAQKQKPPTEFGFIDKHEAVKKRRNAKKWLPQLEEYISLPETKHGAALMLTIKGGMTRVKFPPLNVRQGGDYVIRVKAAAYPNVDERFRYLEFTAKSPTEPGYRRLGWRKISGTLSAPQVVEFPVKHPLGEKLRYFVHQRTHQGRGDKNLWTVHQGENGIGTPPGLWVDWAEMEGPIAKEESSANVKNVFFDRPKTSKETEYAREVITRFANRAFRGNPAEDEFIDKLTSQFAANRKNGQNFKQAMVGPLSIVLSSPSFLYFIESNNTSELKSSNDSKLNDHQLAVRLSYFLWSSPPDTELMQLADKGTLSSPSVLKEQTSRLLADSKSERFIQGFIRQWLQMERLEMFEYKARLFPNFDNASRESSRDEIFETFRLAIKERTPLESFLKSDFVVINDVLADYYGIESVVGHEFRKVQVPTGLPRGGLLGSAAVLAMGSDGIRSSPVERGAWVLRHLLNDPPPPAPPNVPQLNRLEGTQLGARDLQRAHMEEPQCAQCHRKIDPIGYGLEHFDAGGSWREKELQVVRKNGKAKEYEFAIESKGSLPDGSQFADFFELRDAISKHDKAFVRGFAESLIAYGLGRPYGFTDKDLADELIRDAKANNNSVDAFLHSLIQSKTFQSK